MTEAGTLELIEERLFLDQAEECTSRAEHDCTVKATFTWRASCQPGVMLFWCDGRLAAYKQFLASSPSRETAQCAPCGKPSEDHWKIEPL